MALRRSRLFSIASVLALGALLVSGFGVGVSASPVVDTPQRVGTGTGEVKKLPPQVERWQAERERAAELVAEGRREPNGRGVVTLPDGTFVDYELEGTDHIVTLLGEFTDPVHNQIAEPDRSVNNSTYWIPDFNRAHYEDMLFADGGGSYGRPSMRDFYLEQSSGRYTVEGQVSEWVPINAPESEFGANGPDGAGSDNANGPVYRVVDAALQATTAVDEGINWDPAVVDVWDRYDCDADGDFDEPDGYVDHFQLVHAGQGEEEGGGAQGGDAIWSHRWYANLAEWGVVGPADCQFGGYQVPGTDLWVGDYTIEPENGGVGVFAHEFAHDLGLPDLYDTAGGENGTGFWTLMSSGSWADAVDPNAIGTSPVHMGAWEKLALGWLDVINVDSEDITRRNPMEVDLGPAEGSSDVGAQGLRIDLPEYEYTETIVEPEGTDPFYYYSDKGDDLDNQMTRALDAPLASDTALTFRSWYDIETDWDYAYVLYSTDGGTTWEHADGNLSTDTNPNGQNFGNGITGSSGGWVSGEYTLPAGTTHFGFRYWTDGAVTNPGFVVDTIQLGSLSDDGSDPSPWSLDGFVQVENGEITATSDHYYLVESRSYLRNDISLCGAYNFTFGDWLEKFCYARGLLVWYRNFRYEDNDVSLHPGAGQILPVDAHPRALSKPAGLGFWRNRIQTWDATFGVDDNSLTLTVPESATAPGEGRQVTYTSPAVRLFNDRSTTAYYDERIPENSVMTAGSGIAFNIIGTSPNRGTWRIRLHR
jgi:immune inhibitor A